MKLFSFNLSFNLRLNSVFGSLLVPHRFSEDAFDNLGGFLAGRAGDSVNPGLALARLGVDFDFDFRH